MLEIILPSNQTCHVCGTAMNASGCPSCNHRKSIGLIQCRCQSCAKLFSYDEDYAPQVICDDCTEREIRAAFSIIRRYHCVRGVA